jgi:trimeric autotransporter adhesin
MVLNNFVFTKHETDMKFYLVLLLLIPLSILAQTSPGGFVLESGSTSVTIKPDSIYSRFNNTDNSNNTSIGLDALRSVSTGNGNTALGTEALKNAGNALFNTAVGAYTFNPKAGNINLFFNTALGTNAFEKLISGIYNTAIGDSSMIRAATSSHNTAVGYGSMANLDGGQFNVAVGNYAGNAITNTSKNVAIGHSALRFNVQSGSTWPIESNVAIGEDAAKNGGYRSTTIGDLSNSNSFQLRSTNIGNLSNFYTSTNTSIGLRTLNALDFQFPQFVKENTVIGNNAMRYARTTNSSEDSQPKWNTVIGHNALAQTTRQGNVSIGNQSMNKSTLSEHSVVIGHFAGKELTFGRRNVLIGNIAGLDLTTGVENVIIGDSSAFGLISGNRNTLIGRRIQVTSSNITNSTVIGSNVPIATSNTVQLGNPSVTSIGGFQPFTTYSDSKTKENIIYDKTLGLEFIKLLKTARYKYIDDSNHRQYDGLIAQDLEKILLEKGFKFPGLYTPKNFNDSYAISYSALIMPLSVAIQELDSQTEDLLTKKEMLLKKKALLLVDYEKATSIINKN